MKIRYLIDTILSPEITALSFADKYAGIVKTINIAVDNQTDTGIVKRYPVACNVVNGDCANIGLYNELVPDDTKKSVIYWEMIQPMYNAGYTKTNDFYNKRFKGVARLVVWLNLSKLGIDECNGAIYAIPILEKILTKRGKIQSGVYENSILRIEPKGLVKQDINTIFGGYDYPKIKNYYLYPFDFFAIDVNFTLEQCLSKGGTFPTGAALDCVNQIPEIEVCKSLSFDGVNEFINCTNNPVFNFNNSNSFTIATWAKFDNLTGFSTLVSKWQIVTATTTATGYYLGTFNNRLIFSLFYTNMSLIQVRTTIDLNLNEWYYLAVTYDGSSDANGVNLYINGVLQPKTIITNTLAGPTQTNEPLQIGGRDTFYTAGQIAKARVWNLELTPAEVNTQYNGGTIQLNPVQSGNLVVDTDINNATFGTQFNIPDKTGITAGYTSVNMEAGDILNDCPE
jgi:hypothetical protein